MYFLQGIGEKFLDEEDELCKEEKQLLDMDFFVLLLNAVAAKAVRVRVRVRVQRCGGQGHPTPIRHPFDAYLTRV